MARSAAQRSPVADEAARIEEARRATTAAQTSAADPTASVWVSANAGTGKTHVLTNRVLRLLLTGTRPERILCLTYTKAAAAEMSKRVFDKLAHWVTADEAALARELDALQQRAPSPDELRRARDLFTTAIETPGGLKVQTIHAFCERLLQRFPLEAGIAPQFVILDDETGRTLEREAIDAVLSEATAKAGGALGGALQRVVAFAADASFDALLGEAIREREWILAASRIEAAHGAGATERIYRKAFGVGAKATAESLEAALAAVMSDDELAHAARILGEGAKTDQGTAKLLAEARTAKSGTLRIEALRSALLTQEGEPRSRLMTAALRDAHPDVEGRLRHAQGRFGALIEEQAGLAAVETTMALLTLAEAVMQRTIVLKQRRAALDFDDLIRSTVALLQGNTSAQWVLFKLDGGLDHILVDEAQDTAPEQWKVIAALANEFFAGTGAREEVRTVFAVGDEKQSIYGFQGAAPEEFARMGAKLQGLAREAGQPWRPIPLTLSFRSVSPVLEAVDRVFAAGSGAHGVSVGSTEIRHVANRLGEGGLVEIWETEKPDEALHGDAFAPYGDRAPALPVARLADRIATTIEGWLKGGEMLASQGRPVRAGDILILVRRRRPFASAMVAALKARGIAVAGADRLHLTQQLAVADLLALCDFLLLPEDDLALATVLKSPLIGLDDDDLTIIAPDRRGSLWSALLKHAPGNARFTEAAERLKHWRARADLSPPFEFLVEVLDRGGMRARLIERLGPEAAEPIDELMSAAVSYDDGAPPSLQGFVDWLKRSERQIKRDMEHGRDEVRVMTVHGAKGLEAPIVFLPDTCSTAAGGRAGGLLKLKDADRPEGVPPPFLWPVKGWKAVAAVKAAREDKKLDEAEERNRLLYVALTRPRDRLYVAGFEGRKKRDPSCWYDLVRGALMECTERIETPAGPVWRLACAQTALPRKPKGEAAHAVAAQALPEWAHRNAPREGGIVVPLVPSRLAPLDIDAEGEPVDPPRGAGERPVSRQPRGSEGPRFLRGTLTHALLEHLPNIDPATWEAAASRFVDLRGGELSARARGSIVAETLDVLRHGPFAAIFGPGSRAEVPIVAEIAPPAGRGETLRVTGQLDRLIRLDTHVLIVDYKTNRPPPRIAAEVPEAYLLQLAAYRLAVGRIFDLPVRAALLWTEGPRLMEIPGEVLDQAAERLFARGLPSSQTT